MLSLILGKNSSMIETVYDASAKTKKDNKSLNELDLHGGSVILKDLAGLLMSFKTKRIGLIADIEKVLLQFRLQPKDRGVARFLRLEDINQAPSSANIAIYLFARVPFGIASGLFFEE